MEWIVTAISYISNVFWGVIGALGVILFFIGNAGSGTLRIAVPCVCGSATFFVLTKSGMMLNLAGFLTAAAVMMVMAVVVGTHYNKKEGGKE